jgi:ATP-dependent DNA ligase
MRKPALTDRLSFIEFQSPTLVEQAPEGDDWIHEIKHDGYRMIVRRDRDRVRLFAGSLALPIIGNFEDGG